ncbi:hypothetical protein JZ751_023632 [Albula glossodonta]|uniref:Uncharacterized protein n=1 Tax=Albula glossodonta TaxID=121402 RepID=A0A8T2NPF9_9TELE|nr:hypothetical protein JZ751_023632 [Albula glossodonta]
MLTDPVDISDVTRHTALGAQSGSHRCTGKLTWVGDVLVWICVTCDSSHLHRLRPSPPSTTPISSLHPSLPRTFLFYTLLPLKILLELALVPLQHIGNRMYRVKEQKNDADGNKTLEPKKKKKNWTDLSSECLRMSVLTRKLVISPCHSKFYIPCSLTFIGVEKTAPYSLRKPTNDRECCVCLIGGNNKMPPPKREWGTSKAAKQPSLLDSWVMDMRCFPLHGQRRALFCNTREARVLLPSASHSPRCPLSTWPQWTWHTPAVLQQMFGSFVGILSGPSQGWNVEGSSLLPRAYQGMGSILLPFSSHLQGGVGGGGVRGVTRLGQAGLAGIFLWKHKVLADEMVNAKSARKHWYAVTSVDAVCFLSGKQAAQTGRGRYGGSGVYTSCPMPTLMYLAKSFFMLRDSVVSLCWLITGLVVSFHLRALIIMVPPATDRGDRPVAKLQAVGKAQFRAHLLHYAGVSHSLSVPPPQIFNPQDSPPVSELDRATGDQRGLGGLRTPHRPWAGRGRGRGAGPGRPRKAGARKNNAAPLLRLPLATAVESWAEQHRGGLFHVTTLHTTKLKGVHDHDSSMSVSFLGFTAAQEEENSLEPGRLHDQQSTDLPLHTDGAISLTFTLYLPRMEEGGGGVRRYSCRRKCAEVQLQKERQCMAHGRQLELAFVELIGTVRASMGRLSLGGRGWGGVFSTLTCGGGDYHVLTSLPQGIPAMLTSVLSTDSLVENKTLNYTVRNIIDVNLRPLIFFPPFLAASLKRQEKVEKKRKRQMGRGKKIVV